MKKIKLTTKKLQLSKERIADLTTNDMLNIYGGTGYGPCYPTYNCGGNGTALCYNTAVNCYNSQTCSCYTCNNATCGCTAGTCDSVNCGSDDFFCNTTYQ